MSTSQVLQHLYSLDISSPNLSRSLYRLIQRDEEDQYLSSLRGPKLDRLVNFLDEALGTISATDDVYRQCLHKLQAICGQHMILPSSHDISGDLVKVGDHPISLEGGTADVWEGTHGGRKVCIKSPRATVEDLEAVTRSFLKEAIIWKRLRHPNIVPFIGVTRDPLQFVSEYVPNGTLTKYVAKNPSVDRVALLLDVTEGLNYLHANYTIHGDLKGPNVLIDHNGSARLTDFGLASVVRGLNSVLVTKVKGYTEAWAAPEVLEKGDKATPEADIFAFGMIVIEVFTGMYPFDGFTNPIIILKITNGERPARPSEAYELGLTDSLWNMTLRCWGQDPAHRPKVTEVVGLLRECYDLRTLNLPLPDPAPQGTQQRSGETLSSLGLVTNPPPSTSGANPKKPLSEWRMDGIAKELVRRNPGPGGAGVIELLTMCDYYHTVPASYQLEGVTKEGDRPKSIFPDTEIWEGKYDGKVVVLKVLRGPRVDSHMQKTDTRFWREVVLMKQLEHGNILPFHGISTTVADFCLVFPWYKNGTIMEHLKRKPDISRSTLLFGVASGLCFLHENRLVHGALSPRNVLIDNNGVARLAPAHQHSILAVPDTLTAGHSRLWGGVNNAYYPAPEFHVTKGRGVDWTVLITPESDVYGIGMVIYEVLTGKRPYFGCGDIVAMSKVQAGEIPQHLPDSIPDPIWTLLEGCWSRDPSNRPSIVQVRDALSQSQPTPPPMEEPPNTDNNPTVPIPDVHSEGSVSGVVQSCIDEIAEELAGQGAKDIQVAELRMWCEVYRTVPTSYKLEDVVREGGHSQRISQETEIWKGRYKGEVVALRVPRVPHEGFDILELKSRFCVEAVSTNYLEHGNVVPFYGVSTTVADICLVYPWYKNGNIVDYVKKKPNANRFYLLSGAVNGLRYAHEHGVSNSCLRPSHLLVDDNGTARLEVGSTRDVDKQRYSAPEITYSKSGRTPSFLSAKEDSVYGMAMITYEVLTRSIPYSECDDAVTISNIRAGKRPKRSGWIYDPVWKFLKECWSMDGRKRPSVTQVYDAFSRFGAAEDLPGKLKLELHSINVPFIPLDEFRVALRYGKQEHQFEVRMRTKKHEHTWNPPRTWLITTDLHLRYQSVSIKLHTKYTVGNRMIYRTTARGDFSLPNNVNELVRAKLAGLHSGREGVAEISLRAV